jgi:hypothetical protein
MLTTRPLKPLSRDLPITKQACYPHDVIRSVLSLVMTHLVPFRNDPQVSWLISSVQSGVPALFADAILGIERNCPPR